jgi:hypothetical protein
MVAVLAALMCAVYAHAAWSEDIYITGRDGQADLCANLGGWAIGTVSVDSERCTAVLEAARHRAELWTWTAVWLAVYLLVALPTVTITGMVLSRRRRPSGARRRQLV